MQTLQLHPALPAHMKYIKGGSFEMGDNFGDCDMIGFGCGDDEKPVHYVKVNDFFLCAYCVTFEEYDTFCKATGKIKPEDEGWGRGYLPVINVTWYDAVEYCNWLSGQNGLTLVYTIDKTQKDPNNYDDNDDLKWLVTTNWSANGYRLPTEVEWEYAAREGGKHVRFGNGHNILRTVEANFDADVEWPPYFEFGECRKRTSLVNSFAPNALGLYNMSGNVWEWCWDWYDDEYYANSPLENPRGAEGCSHRVLRGGGWNDYPLYCRAVCRNLGNPIHRGNSIGFRLAFSSQ
ncbi:hypothetical protein C7N43_39585 [Sphingobacteriales bacterium UPWRP_1]|nr:hypothetical protein C7N43_39585 [Sphingobacteriales bacterium UPWRP_1]